MLGGDQPGEDDEPSGPDHQIVVPAPVPPAPQLADADPAPLRPVQGRELLEGEYPMDHALQEHLRAAAGEGVDEEDGGPQGAGPGLEGEDLPAVAERALREEPELRARVEHDPGR